MYRLMSYGITPEMLPFEQDGSINRRGAERRLDSQQEKERALERDSAVFLPPNSRDVVLGRGYPFQVRRYRSFLQNTHLMFSLLIRSPTWSRALWAIGS